MPRLKTSFQNRPHEYRAWFCGKMYYEIVIVDYEHNVVQKDCGCPLNAGLADFMAHDDLDTPQLLMEFIGGYDKSGQKIFEADVIKDTENGGYGVVVWDNERAGFKVDARQGWNHPIHGLGALKDWEVLGNIVEEPDILDGMA